MTWVIVMAMLTSGHLQFSNIGPYETKQRCEEEFFRLVDKYHDDGIALANINGGCYMVKTPWPR